MRAYVITTGILFALLVLAHVARLFAEGPGPLADPFFLASTGMAAAMSLWAWFVVRRRR